jgi:hypothetical protein
VPSTFSPTPFSTSAPSMLRLFHFIHERIVIKDIRVLDVLMTSQFADIFTKELPSSVFSEVRSSLNIYNG